MIRPLTPHPLQKGDTLGVIAPAGRLYDEDRFILGIKVLREMGFIVKFPRNLWPGSTYLADNDKNRGQELNDLLRDSEVKALIAVRGGYGCLRMLEGVDVDLVRHNPKFLIGFSDISILQNYLLAKTGLISLHGPVVTSLGSATRESLKSFFNCLSGHWQRPLGSTKLEIMRGGAARSSAVMVGGNLASLITLLGTPFDSSWDHKIVFLEDTNEAEYKLDRMLTQLKLAGKLDNLAGLILGDFSSAELQDDIARLRYREMVWSRVLELCKDSEFPIWGNFPAGHCPDNHTFPLGAKATMEGATGQLTFDTVF
ncbi:MAG: S66 peptidase family protein [Desulforhopalus sp.]